MLKRYTRLYAFYVAAIAVFLLLSSCSAVAQKYIFTHYDIEDGLIQSQVVRISEDQEHRLWIATMGGACRFDGNTFKALNKQQGLSSNFVFTVFADKQKRLWIGSTGGLSMSVNNKVINFSFPASFKRHSVTNVVQDSAGQIWFVMDRKLCRPNGKTVTAVPMPALLQTGLTALAVDAKGVLHIVVHGKGIYKLVHNRWQPVVMFNEADRNKIFRSILFDRARDGQFFVLAEEVIYLYNKGVLTPYEPGLFSKETAFLCMQQDKDFNLWIGTAYGAYRVNKGVATHFTAGNGFTDQMVTDIYLDANSNLWLGAGASGFYKYEGDNYRSYSSLPGMQSDVLLMGFGRHPNGDLLLGTDGFGILKYDGHRVTPFWRGPANTMARFVQSMHTDKNGTTWIGTNFGGLWKFNGHQITLAKGTQGKTITGLTSSPDGTLWMTTPAGIFYMENDTPKLVPGIHTYNSAILTLGNDSVFIGGLDGIKLLVNKKYNPSFKVPALNTSAVYSIIRYAGNLVIGTDDKGIIVLDLKTHKYTRCGTANGLNSDIVYSLAADKYGIIWAGTGRGVNRLTINKRTLQAQVLVSASNTDVIAEANQNAVFYDGDYIYMGNTKGLSIYKCNGQENIEGKPNLILQSIKVAQYTDQNKQADTVRGLRSGLSFGHDQNHISFSYLGIYLRNPKSVYYQYKLAGLDRNFSQPAINNEANYPALPPGKYTFIVKAGITPKMLATDTMIYSFSIEPPFYQTITFRILAILLLIMLGVALQYYITHQKNRRRLQLEAIRNQEQINIRQQTAEDFHDDLGNKLTRISVLSDILDTKLGGEEDKRNLVKQIKQNVDALYKGTKDILWALDPKSDNLYEILLHIKDFGRDLFEDTNIVYHFNDVNQTLDQIKLPMEYCRNLTMICKELLTNILKHAHAGQVHMQVSVEDGSQVRLLVTDDGRGFDTSIAYKGRGLNNINKRMKRISGQLSITSNINGGTTIQVNFVVPKHRLA